MNYGRVFRVFFFNNFIYLFVAVLSIGFSLAVLSGDCCLCLLLFWRTRTLALGWVGSVGHRLSCSGACEIKSMSPALTGRFFTLSHQASPRFILISMENHWNILRGGMLSYFYFRKSTLVSDKEFMLVEGVE